MGKLVVTLLILVGLGTLGLVAYAYIGPLLGADFSAPQQEIRVPVTLTPGKGG